MDFNTITTELFTNAFSSWWDLWKNEIGRWDVAKTELRYLTMEISKQ